MLNDLKLEKEEWITLHIFYTNRGINLNDSPKSKLLDFLAAFEV